MREESEFMYNEEETLDIVQKYESMLERKGSLFFDVLDFEHIIDYYLDIHNAGQALRAAEIALDMHPYSTEIQLRMAELHILGGQPERAFPILAYVERVEPGSGEVHFLRGNAHLAQSRPAEAEASFQRALVLEVEAPENLNYRIAALYQEIEEYATAIPYLLEAHRRDPQNPAVLFELGFCYESLGELQQSEEAYNKFLDINPFSTNAWYNLGIVHSRQDQTDQAIEAYGYALAVDPNNASAMFNLANTYALIGRFAEALELFKEQTQWEPNNPRLLCSLGECCERLGRLDEARSAYQSCLAINPSMAEALYGLGVVMLETGQLDQAKQRILEALAIDPKQYDFWLGLAKVNLEMDQFQDTEEAYRQAISLDPEEPDAYIGLAETLLLQGKYQLIQEMYQLVAPLFPAEAMLRVVAAAAQFLANRPADAIRTLKLAKRIDPEAVNTFRSIVSIPLDHPFNQPLARL